MNSKKGVDSFLKPIAFQFLKTAPIKKNKNKVFKLLLSMRRSKRFKKAKTIALLVMLALSFIVFLDWFVKIEGYFPIKVHEFGHRLVMERKPGVQYCYYNHIPEAYQTTCIYEEGSITDLDKRLFGFAGYSLELLFAFFIMITPFSLLGGAWMLRIQHAILLNNNNPSNDLYWIGDFWKAIIAIFLMLMFILALIIQNKWIDYGWKLKAKLKRRAKAKLSTKADRQ